MTGTELKSLWKQGRTSLGYTSVSSDLNVALMAGQVGFDWMLIDQMHAPRNPETVAAIIQAAKRTSACPIVRVPRNDPVIIGQYLDQGAIGVMVPEIRTASDARQAVRSCRYQPEGLRKHGLHAASDFGWNSAYYAHADQAAVVIIQVEHVDFSQEIDSILTVEGIDALYIRTMDLSRSMNLGGQWDQPDFIATVQALVNKAEGKGIPIGVPAQGLGGMENSLQWLAQHAPAVRLLGLGIDLKLIERGARVMLETVMDSVGSR